MSMEYMFIVLAIMAVCWVIAGTESSETVEE
jgi:hypothetical protein